MLLLRQLAKAIVVHPQQVGQAFRTDAGVGKHGVHDFVVCIRPQYVVPDETELAVSVREEFAFRQVFLGSEVARGLADLVPVL